MPTLLAPRLREFQLERAPNLGDRPNLAQLMADALAAKELAVEFATPPSPEKLKGLLDGLRQHFPRRAFWYRDEGQGRIYVRETDLWQIQLMRVFCVGFLACR